MSKYQWYASEELGKSDICSGLWPAQISLFPSFSEAYHQIFAHLVLITYIITQDCHTYSYL